MVSVDKNEGVSFSALRTRLLFNDVELALGTSFFYAFEGGDYLVTARHNLTGRHAETGETLHRSAGTPNAIEILLTLNAASTESAVRGHWVRIDFADVTRVTGGGGIFGHADGAQTDVACIGPFPHDDDLVSQPVNALIYDPTPLRLEFGDDAFVLGYPHFIDGGAPFLPIWKRASIASDPAGRRILLDTATRRGMSGSPVFARQSGVISPRGVEPTGTGLDGRQIIGTAQEFMGCYSGRLGESDALDSQLGQVWSVRAIEEVLGERVPLVLPL